MTPTKPRLLVTFKNGSCSLIVCDSVQQAHNYAQTKITLGISHKRAKVARIELLTTESSIRALWDADWDPLSQAKGLACPV